MSVKCPFITNLVPGKVEKENHIRKLQKSEERKVKQERLKVKGLVIQHF